MAQIGRLVQPRTDGEVLSFFFFLFCGELVGHCCRPGEGNDGRRAEEGGGLGSGSRVEVGGGGAGALSSGAKDLAKVQRMAQSPVKPK